MKKRSIVILIFVVGAAIVVALSLRELPGPADADEESPAAAPVVPVKLQPLRRGDIEQPLAAYGSVVAEPGKSVSLSVPYECVVTRMRIVPGQPVKAGDPLVEVIASAATRLQIGQAQAAVENSRTELRQTRQRYDLKLATNQELNQAQKAADEADLQLRSLASEGAQSTAPIKSPADGIVTTLGAQAGQIVPAGGILAEVVAADAIEVRLGVEPDDLGALRVGAALKLQPINQPGAQAVPGRVRMITASVNPATRLVDVFATLPQDSGFLLGGYVRAEFARGVHDAVIAPVAALILDSEGFRIFTVRDGRAIAHVVKVGLRTKEEAEIRSGLSAGEGVVIRGNYELEDGMGVKVQP
ncbi:MAG: efflux RND transporter periplasmic adaptor subunit [Terrimicrobiaceae bacterium]|nr:efflux RND transporter periplasmic adaptor subunit [Terrimicrobiaceae bacterium]